MTFGEPGMLAALGLLVPLAALYFLKVKPARREVTALFLWRTVLETTRQTALFRRLRDILSLFIMALVATAVVLALAKPTFGPESQRDILFLVDTSASMGASDAGGTRLDAACRAVRELIQAMPLQQRASLAALDTELRQFVDITDSPRDLLRGLDRLAARERSGNARTWAGVAGTQGFRTAPQIVFVTDGGYPPPPPELDVRTIRVGAPARNAGIVDFDMVNLPGPGGRTGVFFRCVATDTMPMDAFLYCGTGKVPFRVFPVQATPDGSQPVRVVMDHAPSGRYRLELSAADSLAMDNRAYAILPRRRLVRVRVDAASGEGHYVRQCIAAFSD